MVTSLMYDSGLCFFERVCVAQAIEEFLLQHPEAEVQNYRHWPWMDGGTGADWLIENASWTKLDERVRIDVSSLIELMEDISSNSRMNHQVFITSYDAADGSKKVNNLTVGGFTVITLYPYRRLKSAVDRCLKIKAAVQAALAAT